MSGCFFCTFFSYACKGDLLETIVIVQTLLVPTVDTICFVVVIVAEVLD